MDLTIDRRVWLRGEGSGPSRLLRESDGKMCCVGMYLAARGVASDLLRGKSAADQLDCRLAAGWLLCVDVVGQLHSTDDAMRLYVVNDARDLSDGDREAGIAALFAAHGVTVTFVGGADAH